jgi:hypothetical protein
MHIDSDAASIDLTGAQMYHVAYLPRQSALIGGLAYRLQGFHGAGDNHRWMVNSRLHCISLSHEVVFVRHSHDGWRKGNVTDERI